MPKKILLADDSITIQKVVELTFSDGDYEVIATSNGAKAIQKLSEMRPDIILSDIIMPEKNGYEVCEYVKSHPEFRTIPVILLTGTFEPFDPDRAEKAGCDAVVTKPFESQSLIHKVEELLAQSAASSAGSAASSQSSAQAEPSPKAATPPTFESQWDTSVPEETVAPVSAAPSFATEDESDDDSPFGAAEQTAAAASSPVDSGFQFDDPFSTAHAAATQPSAEDNKGDDLFGDASRDDSPAASLPFESPAMPPMQDSPFDSTTPLGGGETRAFPRMSFDDLDKMKSAAEAAPEPEPVSPPPDSPWADPAATESAFGGETRAFPRMSFEDLQKVGLQEPSQAQPAARDLDEVAETRREQAEPAAFSGETRAFPKMSLEDLQNMQSESASSADSWPAEAKPVSTDWPTAAATPAFEGESASSSADVLPFAQPETSSSESEEKAEVAAVPQESVWATPEQDAPTPPPLEFAQPLAAAGGSATASPGFGDDPPFPLTDEQIDKIARRMVELMSQETVRNIAWEVIPDMAQMVVRERIRELEAES
ncbi:MAG TPA: response regulator [Thermoanaerobaculia bacterium]|nr:response regulator [Thermoanaerobaculia bacterium]